MFPFTQTRLTELRNIEKVERFSQAQCVLLPAKSIPRRYTHRHTELLSNRLWTTTNILILTDTIILCNVKVITPKQRSALGSFQLVVLTFQPSTSTVVFPSHQLYVQLRHVDVFSKEKETLMNPLNATHVALKIITGC